MIVSLLAVSFICFPVYLFCGVFALFCYVVVLFLVSFFLFFVLFDTRDKRYACAVVCVGGTCYMTPATVVVL